MKSKITSLLAIPLLVIMSGCGTYYEAGHSFRSGYPSGHSHVSVGAHGHLRGDNAVAVVGALIVGGIIGAAINEAENDKREAAIARQQALQNQQRTGAGAEQTASENVSDSDNYSELNDGYTIDNPASETQEVGQIWYQSGEDGHCYLMQGTEQGSQIVQAVPDKRCRKN